MVPRETPPAAAVRVFGDALPAAEEYARRLCSGGVAHGLIGPREAARIWDRHVLNCAVVEEVVPPGVDVIDVGSGAGLPGIPLALARPDLRVTLVEPLLRRATFLEEMVAGLGLGDRVQVERVRAEDVAGRLSAPVVTARAVAPLARLAGWCLPLVAVGGALAAMKGRSAADEVERDTAAVRDLGGSTPTLVECGSTVVTPPVAVVLVSR